MFTPATYSVALAMMILSMLCWGSWANTQKATGSWRFELFYWDYVWGVVGGLVWGVGTISNFVASYARMVGPAASYSLGQGATMISALWGVFVWKEFRGAGRDARLLLVMMFALFIVGLAAIALAPMMR